MTKSIFIAAAAVYWISFLLRFLLWTRENRRLEAAASVLEKLGMIVFTGALVLYIGKLQIVNGEVLSPQYDRPVSFLLFAWAIGAAQMVTEIVYGNRITAVFANFWTALSLTITSASTIILKRIFTNDLEWLSFHRLCFLLGYAFCMLAFPLIVRYLHLVAATKVGQPKDDRLDGELQRLDRMAYRMVLWALPLLTIGIIAEILLLVELHRLPRPEQIWTDQQEALLALTAWFLCGLYLHTRLFFGWSNIRSAVLYIGGLVLILGGHFTQIWANSNP